MMTPRDNWYHFFTDDKNEYVPTTADFRYFRPAALTENRARGLVAQQTPPDPATFGGIGWFGVRWEYEPSSRGSIDAGHILTDFNDWPELAVFPDLDVIDWEGIARDNAEYLDTDKMISGSVFSGFFERMISFSGFMDAAMALVDEDQTDAIKALFDRLADLYIDYARRQHRWFGTEHFTLHDDWGSQRSPFFSKAVHDEMILPYVKKVAAGIHAEGCFYEQHSCGKIEQLIPGLIDTGADTWMGQLVNDKPALVERYGDRFRFGVEFGNQPVESDAAAERIADEFAALYRGRRVWCFMGKGLSPARAKLVAERINERI